MRMLVKDSEDNVMVLISNNGSIPEGFTAVAEEDIAAEELALARRDKMHLVRNRRNAMMLAHDTFYLIALKDSADTTDLLADRQALLDLPEDAQSAVDALETVEDIQAYDAFAELDLSRSYE